MSSVDIPFQVSFTHRWRQTVDVAGRDFGVLEDVLVDSDDPVGDPAKVLLWLDSNLVSGSATGESFGKRLTGRLQASDRLDLRGAPTVIPGGEACKHDEHQLRELLDQINDHHLDRRSRIIVAGGGAVLDVAGFAAAIAHRGIRLVRLPSTTLAQADSGVGVKNAINYFGKKNWIGTFAVPWAVINDVSILQTLPDRDFRSGLTEAIKVALLKDASFFDFLRSNAVSLSERDLEVSTEAISRSCRYHLEHITGGGDPFEALEARPLDFGHWSAHKLEPMTNYSLRHGEAVGIGVALDTLYSAAMFGLDDSIARSVCQTLVDLGTPLWCDALEDCDTVLSGLEEFRQHLGGRLTITMLEAAGRPIDVHEIDASVMRTCIGRLREIAGRLDQSTTKL